MFVIYQVENVFNHEKPKYHRLKEFGTLEEASEFMDEHKNDGNYYCVVME